MSLAIRRLAADALGTKHHLEVFAAARMRDLIPRIAEVLDEPMGDQSIFPTFLLSTITREHVKVALGGDGSDEILMGYRSFLPLKVAWSLDRGSPSARRDRGDGLRAAKRIRRPGDPWSGIRTSPRAPSRPATPLRPRCIPRRRALGDGSKRPRLSAVSGFDEPDRHFAAPGGNRFSASDATVLAYLRGYLQEDILVKVDRASMASSLEVRSPFLDPEVVDFALALPPELRLRGRVGKYLLRILMRGRIPDEILDREEGGVWCAAQPVAPRSAEGSPSRPTGPGSAQGTRPLRPRRRAIHRRPASGWKRRSRTRAVVPAALPALVRPVDRKRRAGTPVCDLRASPPQNLGVTAVPPLADFAGR